MRDPLRQVPCENVSRNVPVPHLFHGAIEGRIRRIDLVVHYLSFSKLSGNFEPGGKSGFSSGFEGSAGGFTLDVFDELPALPDFTIPLRGGMRETRDKGERVTISRTCACDVCDTGVYSAGTPFSFCLGTCS